MLVAASPCVAAVGHTDPITPRQTLVRSPCEAMAPATVRNILRHGAVNGSYYYRQTGDLTHADTARLVRHGDKFQYVPTTMFEKPGERGISLVFREAGNTGGGVRIHALLGGPTLRSRAEIVAAVAEMCCGQTGNLRLATARFYVTADVDRASRQINRTIAESTAQSAKLQARQARTAAKEARTAAERERKRRKNSISIEEVARELRAQWPDYRLEFGLAGATFGKVRNLKCRKIGELFRCTVGVTATSANGPEYEEGEMNFIRDERGEVEIYADDILVIN